MLDLLPGRKARRPEADLEAGHVTGDRTNIHVKIRVGYEYE